ncbi:MAG: cysteine--tRNA ligase [Patescibacteria group bacterium]
MAIYFYNTLHKQKQEFKPLKPGRVGMYTCGPTVYNFAHVGNLRTYIFEDILKRTLQYNGLNVKHVMNITDVGHLTDDADSGEDKMEKGAAREKKSVWDIADYYTKAFKQNLADLNILEPEIWCKATDHIPEQIEMIKQLEAKGFTYTISDGVYFDTAKLNDYGKLAKLDISGLQVGARVEQNTEKRNITDFALWKFSPQNKKRAMEWDSPWGIGFPGWHIECSAMSIKYLGETLDIHCGGIDHVPVHHTNEIAQAEAMTGKPFVNYWLHGEFLLINKDKMAKSGENFLTVSALQEKKYKPLAYRYFCLGAHYRSKLNFSWEALDSAQNALNKIYANIAAYDEPIEVDTVCQEKFQNYINDDLDMPKVLALVWEIIKSNMESSRKLATLLEFDKVLGLELEETYRKAQKDEAEIPDTILELASQREIARNEKNWRAADEIRDELLKKGYIIEDSKNGYTIKPV